MSTRTNIIITLATLALSTTLMSGNAAADTTNCVKTITASGSSAGGIARFRKRRAKRRAVRSWENKVSAKFGSDHADIDDATITSEKFGLTSRGNTSYTVTAKINVCS